MKPNKYLVEIVLFFALLAVIVAVLYDVLRYKDTGSGGGTDNFYAIDVPIDVIIFGSSHAACTVNNGILWNDGGIASYTFTAGAQKADGTAFFIEEAIAHNKPKVALIETYLLADISYDEGAFYRTALTTKFSNRFVRYVSEVVKENDLGREMLESILLRMPMVHSRYNELSSQDFVKSKPYSIGYVGSRDVESFDVPELTSDLGEISEKVYANIDRIIEVCRTNEVEPIFFLAPYVANLQEQQQQNSLKQYIEEKGCIYLDYLHAYKDSEIDFSRDFRDYEHLNDYGAEKISRDLINQLKENYILYDHRDKKGYERWDDHARFLDDRQIGYELDNCQEIGDYAQVLLKYKDQFSYIVELKGNYRALGDDIFEPFLSELGINNKQYENGGKFVVGKDLADNISAIDETSLVGDGTVDRQDLNQIEYNGMSIIVVDQKIGYVIDSAYVDVYEGLGIKR